MCYSLSSIWHKQCSGEGIVLDRSTASFNSGFIILGRPKSESELTQVELGFDNPVGIIPGRTKSDSDISQVELRYDNPEGTKEEEIPEENQTDSVF